MSDKWGDEGQPVCPILERSMIRHNIVICMVWIAPSRPLQRGPEHRPLAL